MNKYSITYGRVPTNLHGYRIAVVEAENENDAKRLLYQTLGVPFGTQYCISDIQPYSEANLVKGKVLSL